MQIKFPLFQITHFNVNEVIYVKSFKTVPGT